MAIENIQFLQTQILQSIGDPDANVRSTVGTLLTVLAGKGPESCASVLTVLTDLLSHPDDTFVHGALNAIDKLCEDYCLQLQNLEGNLLDPLLLKLIEKFSSPHEVFRVYSLNSVNQFLVQSPTTQKDLNRFVLNCPALSSKLDLYLGGVFRVANDPSVEIRQLVCIAFSGFVQRCLDVVEPHLGDIIEYMLAHTTTTADSRLSLEACEFWTTLANTDICKTVLKPYLQRIVPTLVNAMVYSDIEICLLIPEENDGMIPDLRSDIRPRYRSLRSTGNRGSKEEEYDPSGWTLRKCAANSLDVLASIFGGELLPHLIPLLMEKMKAGGDWKELESAILAIGAVAKGCTDAMSEYLPEFVPSLVKDLQHEKPLVRTISCWSLTRYSCWICISEYMNQGPNFRPVLEGLLNCVLDKNKKVQESACSSLATFVEEARDLVNNYLELILQHLMEAFERYQAKNFLILLDAINTFVNAVDESLITFPKYRDMILNPLMRRWSSIDDDNRELCSILECLTSLAIALGNDFQAYAKGIFDRCLRLMRNALDNLKEDPDDQDSKDLLISSIDLVDGMVEGFGSNIRFLIQDSSLGGIIFECMTISDPSVRQNTFALIGDLSKNVIDFLKPGLHDLLRILIENLNPQHPGVCNNATWAIGDIAIKVGRDMDPYIQMILERFVSILQNERPQPILLSSICLGIGRLCVGSTAESAKYLSAFIAHWCQNIRTTMDEEKEDAFRGICAAIKENPEGVLNYNHFMLLCDSIACYQHASTELKQEFHVILHSFKNMIPNWDQMLTAQQFSPELIRYLKMTYDI
eukprot:CAMPEP_0201479834 /NCGR_PEP_ID=MMETSP0151_2-20130828/4473_1 /ASSEMBLY_ACC=CAM_ASM_000257 /TAXON_ID=200890 /ORGANISM="Paramoeba atlantica, Strain 621/1 / CCAP 1560/9" /LENGTH=807 /DNA_ID=CAMNT_0047861515 /DNA_START=304 /DNA_END=2727 /DNA_ORIENTATION=+